MSIKSCLLRGWLDLNRERRDENKFCRTTLYIRLRFCRAIKSHDFITILSRDFVATLSTLQKNRAIFLGHKRFLQGRVM